MSSWDTGTGIWCARNEFSIGLPSRSVLGPVQPLGARKIIIGHCGNELSLFSRAFF